MKGFYNVRVMADGKYFDCRQMVVGGSVVGYENDDGPVAIPEVCEIILLTKKFTEVEEPEAVLDPVEPVPEE